MNTECLWSNHVTKSLPLDADILGNKYLQIDFILLKVQIETKLEVNENSYLIYRGIGTFFAR